MKRIKPPALKLGDTIGIVTPASPPDNLELLTKGISYLENKGYKIKIGKHVYDRYGYLAGSDIDRAGDINNFFSDNEVKAIFSVRGGYGAIRLIPHLDFELIRNNPKIFVGYSDITAIQIAIFKKTGLITFLGPMLSSDFSKSINKDSDDFFWNCLSSPLPPGPVPVKNNMKINYGEKAIKGKIIGGNLSTINSLIGTQYFPELDSNTILLLEDVNEEPYRIDRLLQQLKLAGKIENIKGIILGDFSTCLAPPEKQSLSLDQIFEGVFKNKTFIKDFHFGHVDSPITVPIGIEAQLTSYFPFVTFTESAVE